MYVPSAADALAAAQATVDAEAEAAKAAAAQMEALQTESAQAEVVEPLFVRLRSAASAERKWVSAYCLAYAGGSTAAFSELARAVRRQHRGRRRKAPQPDAPTPQPRNRAKPPKHPSRQTPDYGHDPKLLCGRR